MNRRWWRKEVKSSEEVHGVKKENYKKASKGVSEKARPLKRAKEVESRSV